MKKLLFGALLALGLISLTGCYESAPDAGVKKCGDGQKIPMTKCGAGKCGSAK